MAKERPWWKRALPVGSLTSLAIGATVAFVPSTSITWHMGIIVAMIGILLSVCFEIYFEHIQDKDSMRHLAKFSSVPTSMRKFVFELSPKWEEIDRAGLIHLKRVRDSLALELQEYARDMAENRHIRTERGKTYSWKHVNHTAFMKYKAVHCGNLPYWNSKLGSAYLNRQTLAKSEKPSLEIERIFVIYGDEKLDGIIDPAQVINILRPHVEAGINVWLLLWRQLGRQDRAEIEPYVHDWVAAKDTSGTWLVSARDNSPHGQFTVEGDYERLSYDEGEVRRTLNGFDKLRDCSMTVERENLPMLEALLSWQAGS
ncbi:hypothetical protein ACIBH1_48835 [Nonomuraea sp. NPDC050663]|uniref:hypothetical protein n=1 Tax=Nonomuraea sp. NPDC050663 TaxID=3364370 RepID=UPI0037BD3F95